MKISPALSVLLAVLLATASGCAQLNVRHLQRSPWLPHETQSLQMRFWRFEYEPVALEDAYGVRGQAFPVAEGLPEWAARVDELWFAVYLCDSLGRVLAKDVAVLLPREFSPQQQTGIPFEFRLSPDDIGQSEQLFITFGYRMVLSDGGPGGAQPRVFFANEGALSLL